METDFESSKEKYPKKQDKTRYHKMVRAIQNNPIGSFILIIFFVAGFISEGHKYYEGLKGLLPESDISIVIEIKDFTTYDVISNIRVIIPSIGEDTTAKDGLAKFSLKKCEYIQVKCYDLNNVYRDTFPSLAFKDGKNYTIYLKKR